jgi:hypothetical protein
MVPAMFVELDKLPLTTSGKVDRRRLPIPEPVRPKLESTYAAPETDTESLIAEIWRKVLHIEHPGIHDNFFDLGGHSLRLAQVIAHLSELTGKTVSIIEAFENPTIHTLARHITGNGNGRTRSGADRAQVRSASKQRVDELRMTRQRHRAASDV